MQRPSLQGQIPPSLAQQPVARSGAGAATPSSVSLRVAQVPPLQGLLPEGVPSLPHDDQQKTEGREEVLRAMNGVRAMSQASGLPLAEQLAMILCDCYKTISGRQGKYIDSKQLEETMSQWTPQEVAAKFLEFFESNMEHFTKKEVPAFQAFATLAVFHIEALGGIEAYKNFNQRWSLMMNDLCKRLEKKD